MDGFGLLVVLLVAFSLLKQTKRKQQQNAKQTKLTPPRRTAPVRTKLPEEAFPAMPASELPAVPVVAPQPVPEPVSVPVPDYGGSLNAYTGEGEDTTHDEHFHGEHVVEESLPPTLAETEEPSRSPLDFSPSGLVNAFIMQEVLQRPGARRRPMPR